MEFCPTPTAFAIWFIGIAAALNQIEVAPAIVNGLFYAVLALVALYFLGFLSDRVIVWASRLLLRWRTLEAHA